MGLDTQIEGVLFYKAEPVKKEALCEFFSISDDVLRDTLTTLSERLLNGGTRLVQTDTTVQLVVSPDLGALIDSLRKDELKRDIGKAGAETLAIILYRGPISRADIDRIRGVNSNFILRNLLIRGLIERREHPNDQRSFLYAVTPHLLNHLGISRKEDLPEFVEVMNSLDSFEKSHEEVSPEETRFTE